MDLWDSVSVRAYWDVKLFALGTLCGLIVNDSGGLGLAEQTWAFVGFCAVGAAVCFELWIWRGCRASELAKLNKVWVKRVRLTELVMRVSVLTWAVGVLLVMVNPGWYGQFLHSETAPLIGSQVGSVLVYVGLAGLSVGFCLAGLVLWANRKVGFYCEHQERDRSRARNEPGESPLPVGRESKLHPSVQKPSSVWDAGYAGSGRTRRYLGD